MHWLRTYCWALFGIIVSSIPAKGGDWIVLRSANFTVLSEASESRTRQWAVEFEIFRRAMTQVLPLETRYVDPLTIVLFRSDRRLRPFKPIQNGEPARLAGYFVSAGGRSHIAVSIEGARDDVREIVFHESVHWHLSAAPRRFPLWFEEGLAEVFGNFLLNGSKFSVGSFRTDSAHYVNISKPIPFAELMVMPGDSLQYVGKQRDRTTLFYQESWLFMHALMFGSGGVGVHGIASYVSRPPSDADPKRDLELGLGIIVDAMDRRLAAYLDHGQYGALKLTFDRKSIDTTFTITPAPDSLVDLTMGYLLVDVHRPDEARTYLLRAAASGPASDPRPQEALALAAYIQERNDEALTYLTGALERKSDNYWVHFAAAELAIHRFSETTSKAEELTNAVEHLIRCVELNPRCIPALKTLGAAAELLPLNSPVAETALVAAADQYPSIFSIQLGAAYVDLRRGNLTKTHARLIMLQSQLDARDSRAVHAIERLSATVAAKERRAAADAANAFPLPQIR